MNSIPMMELHGSTESHTDNNIKTTDSTCPYCGVGCGVTAKVQTGNLGQKSRSQEIFIILLIMENCVLKAVI